jgi:hypothetical protein
MPNNYEEQLDAAIQYIKVLEKYHAGYRKLQERQKELCKSCKKIIVDCYKDEHKRDYDYEKLFKQIINIMKE